MMAPLASLTSLASLGSRGIWTLIGSESTIHFKWLPDGLMIVLGRWQRGRIGEEPSASASAAAAASSGRLLLGRQLNFDPEIVRNVADDAVLV